MALDPTKIGYEVVCEDGSWGSESRDPRHEIGTPTVLYCVVLGYV